MNRLIACIALLLSANLFAASHVIVGKTRPPTKPDDVAIYLEPPTTKYEKIALIESDSMWSFAVSQQGKIDSAIRRMKKDAAKLGATAIILQAVGNDGTAVVMMPSNGSNNGGGVVGFAPGKLVKTVNGLAIWEEKAPTESETSPEAER